MTSDNPNFGNSLSRLGNIHSKEPQRSLIRRPQMLDKPRDNEGFVGMPGSNIQSPISANFNSPDNKRNELFYPGAQRDSIPRRAQGGIGKYSGNKDLELYG